MTRKRAVPCSTKLDFTILRQATTRNKTMMVNTATRKKAKMVAFCRSPLNTILLCAVFQETASIIYSRTVGLSLLAQMIVQLCVHFGCVLFLPCWVVCFVSLFLFLFWFLVHVIFSLEIIIVQWHHSTESDTFSLPICLSMFHFSICNFNFPAWVYFHTVMVWHQLSSCLVILGLLLSLFVMSTIYFSL